MRISKKLAGTASLIAIATAFTFAQPSNANDLVDFFQNTLGVNVTNIRNPQAFARTHFQNKRNEIEAHISYAVSSGRMNLSQAAAFRAELSGITNLQIAYESDGRMTISEARTLSDKLNKLDNKVERYIATNSGGWGNGGFDPNFDKSFNLALNKVRTDINRLENKVETGKLQRRLSINEYNLFKDRLNDQEREVNRMARSDRRFDRREFEKVTDNLAKLDSLITSALSSRNYPTAYGQRHGDRGFGDRNWN